MPNYHDIEFNLLISITIPANLSSLTNETALRKARLELDSSEVNGSPMPVTPRSSPWFTLAHWHCTGNYSCYRMITFKSSSNLPQAAARWDWHFHFFTSKPSISFWFSFLATLHCATFLWHWHSTMGPGIFHHKGSLGQTGVSSFRNSLPTFNFSQHLEACQCLVLIFLTPIK